jgi:AraC-like DNA-binding protein
MPQLWSCAPRPELRPYVRAYAQRRFGPTDPEITEHVPAQLEQVLNFELGVMPGILHRNRHVSDPIWIGGAQTSFPGHMRLQGGVESFAVFFYPVGWSQLFRVPMHIITNQIIDVSEVSGAGMRELWNEIGEAASFERRVEIVERFLMRLANSALGYNGITHAAMCLFKMQGAERVSELASRSSMGLRHFERLFFRQTGSSPKKFARVARFQAALDAKLASPHRSWLDIAYDFGYYDQMHMVHDFRLLGHNTPTKLLADMGDVRPPALARDKS